MRGTFWVVAALATILVAVEGDDKPLLPVPTECPSVDPTDATVHLAHESDCTKFYVCFLGEKIVKDCPYRNAKGERLHFNPVLQDCDWPDKVNCTNKEEVTTDKGSENVTQPTVPSPTTIVPPTTVPPTSSVPSTPDPSTTRVPPTTVSPTIVPTPTNPGDSPTECPPSNSGNVVHLPHESDCSLYYKCDAGRKVVQACPPGLAYNSALQVCDWAENVNCANDANEGENGNESSQTPTPETSTSSVPPTTVSPTTRVPPTTVPPTIIPTPTNPGDSPTECPPSNSGNVVHLPHESDCSLYYKCDAGRKVVQACPPGLAYNSALQVCDWVENVNCGNNANEGENGNENWQTPATENVPPSVPSTSVVPPNPGEVPTECPPDNSGNAVQLPHERNCSLFYKCDEGVKVVQRCPPGLVFNRILQVCDFPVNVNCSDSKDFKEPVRANSTTPPSPPVEIPTECPPNNNGSAVQLPHETNCSLFYKCDEGEKVVQKCPPGLVFNPVLQVCDFPENVNCTNKVNATSIDEFAASNSTTPPPPPVEIPTECPPNNNGSAVQLPHETNCSLFYKCDEGEKVVQNCPPGLVFNPVLQVCDFPQNVNCTNKVNATLADEFAASNSTTSSPPPVEIPTECPPNNNGSAVQLPHETNCSLFYKCDEGEKVVQKCPPGLVFNPVLQVCDFPVNVNCSDSDDIYRIVNNGEVDESAESTSSCISSCPLNDPHNYTILLANTDCTKYCKCSNGQAIVRKCPVGLHFDPVEKVCNYPYIAKCEDVVLL